jgi:energy-coupling factor transport system substrate-specific component
MKTFAVLPRARGVTDRVRPGLVYALVTVVGVASFLYPFWLPSTSSPALSHSADAPLWAAAVGVLAVAALALEVRRGTMNGATVAVLGVLAASAGLLRLIELPGNNAGIFFLVVLGGVAFGPRFGLLLGLTAMAASAFITGGIGPWLPFQMLGLAWMGATAGVLGRWTQRLEPHAEVAVVAAFGWLWGFVYGAILNLWSWPLFQGHGPTLWRPGLGVTGTAQHYWSYYFATSLAWDAAGALFNALLIVLLGLALLRTLRRFAHRLEPAVVFTDDRDPGPDKRRL